VNTKTEESRRHNIKSSKKLVTIDDYLYTLF